VGATPSTCREIKIGLDYLQNHLDLLFQFIKWTTCNPKLEPCYYKITTNTGLSKVWSDTNSQKYGNYDPYPRLARLKLELRSCHDESARVVDFRKTWFQASCQFLDIWTPSRKPDQITTYVSSQVPARMVCNRKNGGKI
jgi:hypothetical protein